MTANGELNYMAHEGQHPFFFTDMLCEKVDALHRALPEASISIYPDATIKTNALPTGIVCAAPSNKAILLPHILRDPGCGYLMFRLRLKRKITSQWNHLAGNMLSNLSHSSFFSTLKNETLNGLNLNSILNKGLLSDVKNLIGADLQCFTQPRFYLDNAISLNKDEMDCLYDDFIFNLMKETV